jgi:hypothetical protein
MEKNKTKSTFDLIDEYGIFFSSLKIEGKDLYSFCLNNKGISGNQIFDVYDNKKKHRFYAYYWATENSFMDIFDDNTWYYNEGDWQDRINDFTASPIFIKHK